MPFAQLSLLGEAEEKERHLLGWNSDGTATLLCQSSTYWRFFPPSNGSLAQGEPEGEKGLAPCRPLSLTSIAQCGV